MNRPHLPPFFTLYDLPADSDERTLKRTYARELKKIDQATELEAFQALRDSYEQALDWLRNNASETHTFFQDAAVTPVSDDQPAAAQTATAATDTAGDVAAPSGDSDTPSFDTFRRANGIPVTPENKEFTQRDPEVLARLAFEAVMAAVNSTQASEQAIDAALFAQMENPDMLNMDARFLFETAIARYLLDGWAPGKEWLFQSAVRHFEWLAHQERARQASGQAFVLLNAIGEWNQLQRVKVAVRNKLLEIMQLAREHQVPRSDYLRTNFSLLCRLAENYDHLLWLITDRKQIQQWIMQTRAEIEEAERIARQPVRPLSGREKWKAFFQRDNLIFWIKDHFAAILAISFFTFWICLGFFGKNDHDRREIRSQTEMSLNNYSKAHGLFLAGEDAYFGRDNQPKNTELAIQLWEQAAKLGSVAAAKSLAQMYSEGNETKRDLTKALHWYSVAAGLGDVPSQQRVGKAYYCGEGTKVDRQKAMAAFGYCANQDVVCDSMHVLMLRDARFPPKSNADIPPDTAQPDPHTRYAIEIARHLCMPDKERSGRSSK